jgi:hypothetical protein
MNDNLLGECSEMENTGMKIGAAPEVECEEPATGKMA